ncbi:hypothetical protein [Polymorphospora rubra]|uniref:Uncharacterized protein n=1 Tax=Polymorphospora rubra TaxID=338584 RepID=A0A810N154_9ACTN|nr:hypothetical protein [Polymorphospora rubra]BCJ65408.1 hypothetical protein Prubr_24290 [Polymorphospora rubra]
MYAWIWRKLPFGLPGKLIGSLMLTMSVLALLWFFVFPWAEPLLPFDDVQVTQDGGGDPGTPGGPTGGEPGTDTGDPGSGDGHDIPYDTDQNNPAPTPSASR